MSTFEQHQLNILKRDTLIHHIPEDDYQVIFEKVATHGQAVIQKYWSIIQNERLIAWILKQGIHIAFQTKVTQQNRLVFGEYAEKAQRIILYEETIQEHPFDFVENTLEFTLLHEIYHVIEAKEKTNYQTYYQVTQTLLGPIKLKSGIISFSELSANYFAYWILEYWRNKNEEITEEN